MTRACWNERLPAIQAFCEGKPIQVKRVTSKDWNVFQGEYPNFDDPNFDWRPKPSPRKLYAVINDSLSVFSSFYEESTNHVHKQWPNSTVAVFTEDV